MNATDLIREISWHVGNTVRSRTIGVTDDPERRRQEHHNSGKFVGGWRHWRADSEIIGRSVEKYFLDKGMKGADGGGGGAKYVYVF